MRIRATLLLVLAMVLPTTTAGAATAVVDETVTLRSGESATYDGAAVAPGVNPLYFEQAPGVGGSATCTKDPDTYCDHVLVELVNPVEDDGDPSTDKTLRRTFSVELTTPAADYDMFLYASDAEGTIGTELGASTNFPTGDTSELISTSVTTRESTDTAWVLVRVIYFAPITPMSLDLRF